MSLYCSTAAVSTSQKQGRKRPDNERRRLKREAGIQRRASSRPGSTTAAAADTEFSGCEDISSGARAPAAASVTTVRNLTQKRVPAACGAATAATPPQAWAWEQRNGLVVLARGVQTAQWSPQRHLGIQMVPLNSILASSLAEERETDGVSEVAVCMKGSSLLPMQW
jgi:hypothetical protein